jgi:histone deacetylase 1/2
MFCYTNVISDDESSDEESLSSSEQLPAVPATREPAELPSTVELTKTSTNSVNTGTKNDKIEFSLDGPLDSAIVEDEEVSIADLQHELMHWHYLLGHISFAKLKRLAIEKEIPNRLRKARPFRCTACMFAKATKTPWRKKAPVNKQSVPAVQQAGDCVSADQLESKTPGFVGQMKAPILTKHRYTVATVFVDHFNRLSFVYLQYSTSGEETLKAKVAFEAFAESHGVRVKHYHADNGRFADNLFRNDCAKKQQTQSFRGVNAHWQNGIAERHIRTYQEMARTMLLHAKRRWPKAVETYLWPYAIRMASDIMRYTPRKDGKIPMHLFSKTDASPSKRHFHPFACPVYVLDSALQQGKGYSKRKWTERARVGLYLGPSPQHARSIHLVLNLETGLVSPQFHVSFDDHFETTRKGAAVLLPASKWQEKAHFMEASPPKESVSKPREIPTASLPLAAPANKKDKLTLRREKPAKTAEVPRETANDNPTSTITEPHMQQVKETPVITRLGRISKPPTRLIEIFDATLTAHEEVTEPEVNPFLHAFAASADPDTMYLREAMRQPDREQFIKAMKKEIQDHTENKHWRVVHRSSLPKGTQILPAVWSMKRKRRIATREIYKWKARLTVHGGRQKKGVNYWETYAPLVQWSTTRLFLTLSVLRGWHYRQLDFVLAYTQADPECDIYMAIPQGFTVDEDAKNYALKLKKNLYGLKQAGRVWNQHLTKRLLELGFEQSQIDPCVFYRGNCILLIYCDDTLMLGPDAKELDEVFTLLEFTFTISDEGNINDYLGIRVTRTDDGKMMFTQPQLIDSIISDCGLSKANAKPKDTPALSSKILLRDENGEPWPDEKWKYRSIIGKFNFLEKSTRPDIAYAVHQCARFTANPKLSHAEAIKTIVRYLKGTREMGIILNPRQQSVECFADASFGGDWYKPTAAHDRTTAKSRTGYVITYCGCPIVWASKLQTEIALSTTEAEYIALSTALREVIPMMDLIQEAQKHGIDLPLAPARVHCKAFEDNSGALEMAQTHKLRPRTKYINVKYHHFRTHVGKTITVHKIDSKNQLADGLTKPLDVTAFCIFRDRIMGYELFFPTISAERESEVKSGFSTGKQFTGHTEAVILDFSKLREAGRVFNHESSTESSESSTLGTNERAW